MELKDFVDLTLEQIFQGVKKAQEHVTEGKINAPTWSNEHCQHPLYFGSSAAQAGQQTQSFLLEFDITVNTESTTSGKTGAGIFVASLGIGAQTGESSFNKQLNRIKFVIPYTLPGHSINKKI